MEAKTRKSAHRALALVLALMLCLTLLIGSAPSSGTAGSGDEATWTQVMSADQFTTGQYYMVTDTNYAPGVLDGTWVTAVEAANAATDAVWTLTVSGDEVTLTDSNDVSIAPKGGNTNGIEQGDYDWVWSFNNGKFTFSGQDGDTVVLASNTTKTTGENRFRAYKTTTVNSNPDQYPSEFTLYKLEGGSGEVTVAAPQASPQSGAVASGTEITLTCATSGANIYYTLDSSEPTTSSTLYSDTAKPVINGEAGATVTLKAIAEKDGVSSAVQTLTYTIKAAAAAPIADGDRVVIYNPVSGLAMSANSVSTYYRAAKAINVENGQISGSVVADLIWDVAVDADGNYTFSNGDNKISINDTNNSLPLNDKNDTWKIEAAATNGCFYIINVGRGTYVQYTKYGSTDEFTTYSYSSGKEASFAMQFIKVAGDAPDPEPTLPIADGDNVVIYAPAYNKALSTNYDGYYNKGTDVTAASDGTLSGYTAADVWTVIDNKDGTWSFSYNGQKLGMGDSYSSMPLGEKNDKWVLEEAADGTWYVKNTVRNAYIEWYARNNNWSAYYNIASGSEGMFALKFYKVTGDIPEPSENPFKAGDSVVIYTPSNNIALSATTKNSYYPIGVKVTISEGEISGYNDTEVWTVDGDASGWTFATSDGKTISMAGSYSSMYPGAGDNETWVLEPAETDGQYYVKNAVRGAYMFWDDEYDDWTTRDGEKTAIAFAIVERPTPDDKPEGLEVRAAPVSGASVESGDTIELTTMEGAAIYYTTDGKEPTKDSKLYSGELTVGSAQVPEPTSGKPLVIKAIAVLPADVSAGTEEQIGEVYTFTYTSPVSLDGYQLYFGQLHSHTNISDGAGNVTEAFQHATQVDNLDFLAVTDHSNSFDNERDESVDLGADLSGVSSEWRQGHEAADAVTGDDFVGIYGFEMTWSDGFGHINTFNTPGFESRSNSEFGNKSGGTEGYQNYYDKLKEVTESLSQFNHPGTTFGDFQDFAFYDPVIDQRITLIEVGNGEGAIGSSGYFPSYEYYTRALDKGWHVAPTNNQDNHKGNWGDSNTARSVVLAYDLTEEAIYDAIANYRVYATEDNDLSILYSLNGNAMGSILPDQDSISISAQISDPTDSADMKVEVIVNGGLVAATKTLSGGNGTVEFSLSDDYSYYYLRVTQSDGNIAVTAPVWTGESVNAGISKTECDTALVVKDEEVNISSELYNNSGSDMTVNSVVYSIDNNNIYTATSIEPIASGDTYTVTFPYTFTSAGKTTVNVTMTATIGETEYTFTSVLQLTVTDASIVTRVLVDGTHYNDYVTGYYSGNMGNFTELAAGMNAQVTIKQFGESITAEDLEDVSLLIISAPLRYSRDGLTASEENLFSDKFVQMVGEYVKGGGTAIVCGLADYQDGSGDFTTYVQINKLLEGIGSTIRVNDDELIDQNNNGGQQYRLYFDDFNYESTDAAVQAALSGLDGSGKVYSSYSGCSINVGNGTPIVFGHDTTYSINSKNPSQGHDKPVHSAGDAYNENDAVIQKGDVVSLATEAVGQGRVYVGGTVWMSDFEVANSEGNDYGDASYANKTIITNILSGLLTEQEVSDIEDVRANTTVGTVFTVEGTITAGNVEPNAFYDTIYIQDETGGINIYPVATTDGTFRVGQKVRVTGSWDQYQGDTELRCISIELIDSNVNPIEPAELGISDASNYEENGGLLSKVSGTVKSVVKEGEAISSVILTDGTNDFRLLFNNYIGYSDESSADITTFVKEGAEISAVGVIYMDPEGVCLRIRDLSEVELVTVDKPEEPDEPDWPIQPGKPSKPSDEDKPEEPDEPFIDVDENDWFYDAVTYVYSEGMMDGVSDTQFAPNSNLTRGMVVTMLYRLEDEPRVTGSSGFDDVASGAWYADAVTWAAENGIVNGVSDAEFAPNDNITREQLAAILYRYAEYNDYDVSGRDDLSEFTDRSSISSYALDAMRWAVDEGLITGITDTTIEPQGTATRAQAATMFMRFMSTVR